MIIFISSPNRFFFHFVVSAPENDAKRRKPYSFITPITCTRVMHPNLLLAVKLQNLLTSFFLFFVVSASENNENTTNQILSSLLLPELGRVRTSNFSLAKINCQRNFVTESLFVLQALQKTEGVCRIPHL